MAEWERALDDEIARARRRADRKRKRKGTAVNLRAPFIVNMVSTVRILPEVGPDGREYRLPLQALAMALGPSAQWVPKQFAATIWKFVTPVGDTTMLCFGSGTMVQVSALTEGHTLYNAQLARITLEAIRCPMLDPATGRIVWGTLAGRTTFEDDVTHNVVGHGHLGYTLDLTTLCRVCGNSVYMKDSFPAAKVNVWLNDENRCVCKSSRGGAATRVTPEEARVIGRTGTGSKRCLCTIKCLVFSNGGVVFIGGRCVDDIAYAFARMRRVAETVHRHQQEQQQQQQQQPGEEVLYERLGELFMDIGDKLKARAAMPPKTEMTKGEAVAALLVAQQGRDFKAKPVASAKQLQRRQPLTPLMVLCDEGRLGKRERGYALRALTRAQN